MVNLRIRNIAAAGFSLIEMSIVLLIMSLVAGGAMTIGQSYTQRKDYEASDATLDELVEGVRQFYATNGRLPCPAPRDVAYGTSTFGKEAFTASNCRTSGSGSGTVVSGSVRIGALPTRDIKIQDHVMKDEFNRRFTYVATLGMVDSSTYAATSGAITINDGLGNNIATDAAFAIISHGKDGRGAFAFVSAAAVGTCGTTKRDHENCDGDATFTDSLFSQSTTDSVFFDDRIRWLTKSAIASGNGEYSAILTKNANQSINNSTWTDVTWQTEQVDAQNMFTSGTPERITIPAGGAGRYLITASLAYAANATGTRSAAIFINNAATAYVYDSRPTISTTSYVQVTGIANLVVGDYVEIGGHQTSGGALNIEQTATRVSMTRIGP